MTAAPSDSREATRDTPIHIIYTINITASGFPAADAIKISKDALLHFLNIALRSKWIGKLINPNLNSIFIGIVLLTLDTVTKQKTFTSNLCSLNKLCCLM